MNPQSIWGSLYFLIENTHCHNRINAMNSRTGKAIKLNLTVYLKISNPISHQAFKPPDNSHQ